MAYVRDWLPLPEARDRISTNGLDRGQASQDICHAIADQKIAVRIIVSKHDYNFAGCVLKERQVGVPVRLDPSCFDWEKSRPIGQWEGGRYPNDIDWGPREIESLEVSTRDLFAIFGAPTPKSGDTAGRTRDASTNPPNEDDEYTKWIAVNVERGDAPRTHAGPRLYEGKISGNHRHKSPSPQRQTPSRRKEATRQASPII